MSTPEASNPAAQEVLSVTPQDVVLPTLFGAGQGLYPQRKDTFVYSFIVHMLAVGLLIWSATSSGKSF